MKKVLAIACFFSILSFDAKAQMFSFADLAEKLQPSVVNISTTHNPEEADDFDNNKVSLGSGFIIDESGHIVTNNHVIDKASGIKVTLFDNTELDATIIGKDEKTDLALIKISSPSKLSPVKMGNSDKIRVGDWVLAIGNPFGLGSSVTAGIVSAKSRDIESGPYDSFLQTDASINQGNSGGPMFDMNGELIGINTAIFSTTGASQGVGFALPIDVAKFVLNELKKKGKVERGFIGIKMQPSSKDIAKSLSLPENQGVIVSTVYENSSAKKAGIEAGDIITKFDGNLIDDTKNLSRMVAETDVGKNVKLELWRGKEIIYKNVLIEPMPIETEKKIIPQKAEILENLESPIIGLGLVDLNPEVLNKYSLAPEEKGVVITYVVENSDAKMKGLMIGDIITQIDKKDIFDINDVATYVNEAKQENNRPILLLVKSKGVLHFVALKL